MFAWYVFLGPNTSKNEGVQGSLGHGDHRRHLYLGIISNFQMAEIYCQIINLRVGDESSAEVAWGKHTGSDHKIRRTRFLAAVAGAFFCQFFRGDATLKRSANLGKFRLRQCSKPFLQLGGCLNDFLMFTWNFGEWIETK